MDHGDRLRVWAGVFFRGYRIESRADAATGEWEPVWSGLEVPAGLFLELPLPAVEAGGRYYRAVRVE